MTHLSDTLLPCKVLLKILNETFLQNFINRILLSHMSNGNILLVNKLCFRNRLMVSSLLLTFVRISNEKWVLMPL